MFTMDTVYSVARTKPHDTLIHNCVKSYIFTLYPSHIVKGKHRLYDIS